MSAVTCQNIITRALRKLGVVGEGDTPDTQKLNDGLDYLKGMYARWISTGKFGRIRDVDVDDAVYNANEFEHVFRDSTVTTTVNLPEKIPNGICNDYAPDYDRGYILYPVVTGGRGTMRLPLDGAIVKVTDKLNGVTEDFLYDTTIKSWTSTTTLALNDEAPMSHRDPSGLAACLCVEMADEFGMQVPGPTIRAAAIYEYHLSLNSQAQKAQVIERTDFF